MWKEELSVYNVAQYSPDVKRDVDNLTRGRIDTYNYLMAIFPTLEALAKQDEQEQPKTSVPEGGY